MTNADFLQLKIDIQTDNDITYQEIALLVDKPEFLQMLPKIREDFEIEELIDIDSFWDKKLDEIYQKAQKGKKKKINFEKYPNSKQLIEFAKEHETMVAQADITDELDFFQMVDTEINLICYYFKRPLNFLDVIRETIFCGKVNGKYFKTDDVNVIDSDSTTSSYFTMPYISIFITPVTTYENLKKLFWIAKDMYKTNKKLAYYKPRVDFVNNIRKYRAWYWERFKETSPGKTKTYETIVEEWVHDHPDDENLTEVDILKGVKRYKNLLAS